MIGPVFTREAVTLPRRPTLFVYRSLYVGGLLLVMCTAWLVMAGAQVIRNIGDMARFGALLFQMLAPLQLALMVFFAAFTAASAIAQEKDRRTILLLLMTELTDAELVLGKLGASLLVVGSMLLSGLPVFALIVLFGGVSFDQVARVFLVTAATMVVAGSLGATIALWREKTFQTLALTAVVLVLWFGLGEVLQAGWLSSFGGPWAEVDGRAGAAALSPLRAVFAAAQATPLPSDADWTARFVAGMAPLWPFVTFAAVAAVVLNGIGIFMLRIWNPSREEHRVPVTEEQAQASIWGVEHDLAEEARAGHVDARLRATTVRETSRAAWDNPILWRETQTWAHGQKIIGIRLAYYLLFALAAIGLYGTIASGAAVKRTDAAAIVPVAARPLAPILLLSLVLVNSLAVTSITGERDGQTLDLLLATDLDPSEFIFGKLGGVFWVAADIILLPIGLCLFLWFAGGITLENLAYLILGLLTLHVFVAVLGLHCGLIHANSRTAIGVSLGTVFFLFLGVATCLVLMVSFSNSFEGQLAPFLAFILGGGVGLYVSLGSRNPSDAISWASIVLPFATFYAITSFLLRQPLGVFLVVASAYGFTTAAMLIPTLFEFDVATGRTSATHE